jgi:hypothetical protein
MADEDGPQGIRGWLLLFVVILAVISPVFQSITMYRTLYADPTLSQGFHDIWPALQAIEWSVFALAAASQWFIAYRLVMVRRWQSVRIAVAVLWSVGLGSTILEYGAIAWLTGFSVGELLIGAGYEAIRPLIFCAIWTAYLLRSRRVANTYPRRDEEQISDVFA